jgi:heat shock protein beta
VKRKISHEARYGAVGSSSLREELFQTFLKAHGSSSSHSTSAPGRDEVEQTEGTSEDSERRRREKKEQALKEREDKVRAERSRMDAEIERSKMSLNTGEGEREFR